MFNLVNIDNQVWVGRDDTSTHWFYPTGWFTAATGGDRIDMTNTAFNGAGRTFFAQWESESKDFIVERWDIPEEVLKNLITEAVAANKPVAIDMTQFTTLSAAELPFDDLAAINDAGTGTTVTLSQGRSVEISAGALASIVNQAGGGDVTLEVHRQTPTDLANKLTPQQLATIDIATDFVFNITLMKENGGLITSFDGATLIITLPWTGPFPARVYYLAENGEIREMQRYWSDSVLHTVSFETTHLSLYMITNQVIQNATSDGGRRGGSPQTGDYRTLLIPIALIALGAMGLGGWVVYNKRIKNAKTIQQ